MRHAFLPVTLGLALWAVPLSGQVPWEGPLMVSPSTPLGWGVYLTDPTPGNGIGIMSTWRSGGPFGFRIGLAEDRVEEVAVFGGVDVSGGLIAATDDLPVDVQWVTGAGFGVGDSVLLSVPLGLSVGREMEGEGVRVNPYATPRVILDALMGSDDPEAEDLALGLAVDLGLDLSFDPGWAVRIAGSVGERRALSIGFTFLVL